jgi:hypothetical protein
VAEKSVGIRTTGADAWVATFLASERADGHVRNVQVVAITAGKIEDGVSRLGVSTDDTLDVTTVSGNLLVGDNNYLALYTSHTQPNGSCLVTPLLCDAEG